MDKRTGALVGLKVGDEVAVCSGGYREEWTIETITKVIPSGQMTTSSGERWLPDGYRFGSRGNFHPGRIEVLTDKRRGDVVNTARMARLRRCETLLSTFVNSGKRPSEDLYMCATALIAALKES